jgi:hypothetical protein
MSHPELLKKFTKLGVQGPLAPVNPAEPVVRVVRPFGMTHTYKNALICVKEKNLPLADDYMSFRDGMHDIGPAYNTQNFTITHNGDALNFAFGK